VNFVAMIIHPTRKSTKRLREILGQLYGYLDQSPNNFKYDEVKTKIK
jgi:hypothetical protein